MINHLIIIERYLLHYPYCTFSYTKIQCINPPSSICLKRQNSRNCVEIAFPLDLWYDYAKKYIYVSDDFAGHRKNGDNCVLMNKFDLEKELPLTPIELFSKNYYQKALMYGVDLSLPETQRNSYSELFIPFEANIFHLNAISELNALTEEAYIPSGSDVAVIKHNRYSHCFLHFHTFFEIVFVMSGSCSNLIASHQLSMEAGDFCIIAPGTQHAISVFTDDCLVLNLLVRTSTFDKAFFGTLAEKDILASFFSKTLYGTASPESYILFHTKGDDIIASDVCLVYEEFTDSQNYKKRMLNSIMNMLFIHLLRNHEKDAVIPHPEGKVPDTNIIAILNHIQANYKTVTLEELTNVFNYSQRHIARLLKEYTGDTFMNIVQKIKIHKSAELLANPDITVHEIVDMIGYTDVSHFYRVFRKHYNMTPLQYRENILEKS